VPKQTLVGLNLDRRFGQQQFDWTSPTCHRQDFVHQPPRECGESSEEKLALIFDRWEASAAAQQGFALPRDTTLWPVIGRASLPASRV
jgi:hypothetical protein